MIKIVPKPQKILVGSGNTTATNEIITKTSSSADDYQLSIKSDGIYITGGEKGVFYARQTLKQLRHTYGDAIPICDIEDSPQTTVRGYYFDTTRGRVPTLKTLKKLVDKMAYYKLNQLQLYVECSYEFSFLEDVWGGKTPLTADDIKELDKYCVENYIELVPSMATFSHMYDILQTERFKHLRECEVKCSDNYPWINKMKHHTMDVTNEDGFKLITAMIDEYMPLFSSNKFNICCDETFDLGVGKAEELVYEKGKGQVYFDYLMRIINYVKSKGKQVMFWGDILIKHSEFVEKLPKDIIVLNWGYEAHVDENSTEVFHNYNLTQYLCPGTTGWYRFVNDYNVAIQNINIMNKYAKKYSVEGMLLTDWGDYGHISIPENSLPLMAYFAGLAWNDNDKDNDKDNDNNNYENLMENVSMLEFGAENALANLVKAAPYCLLTLRDLALLVYYNKGGLNKDKAEMKNAILAYSKMNSLYKKVPLANKKLKALAVEFAENQPLRLMLEGQIWLNKICLVTTKQILMSSLRAEIDIWFDEYQKLWLEGYKPSELFRIAEFIYDVKYL